MRERFSVFRGPRFERSWRRLHEQLSFDLADLQDSLQVVNFILESQADDDVCFPADVDGLRKYRVPPFLRLPTLSFAYFIEGYDVWLVDLSAPNDDDRT